MKKVIGILIILLGLLLLLSNFNILEFDNVSNIFFPLVLVIIGISGMIEKKKIGIFDFSILILGILFLLSNINIIDKNIVWQIFWPTVLMIIGSTFLFNLPRKVVKDKDETKYTAVFSGLEGKNESQEYISSEVSAIFGGIELDFTKIKLKNKEAIITVNVLFGGVTIKLPKDIKLTVVGTPILGGVENKANSDINSKKELIINYIALCGGIEIIN